MRKDRSLLDTVVLSRKNAKLMKQPAQVRLHSIDRRAGVATKSSSDIQMSGLSS